MQAESESLPGEQVPGQGSLAGVMASGYQEGFLG